MASRKWAIQMGCEGERQPSEIQPLHAAAAAAGFRGYSLELYKAWLLLIESLDLHSFNTELSVEMFRARRSANCLSAVANGTLTAHPDRYLV